MQNPYAFQFFKPRNTLLLTGAMTLILGVVLRHPLFLMVSAMCASSVVIEFVHAMLLLREVHAEREHHDRAFQGSEVGVSLRVRPVATMAAELVVIEDNFPPGTAGRVRKLLDFPLRLGSLVEVGYLGTCDHRRGLYLLGPVKLQACDPLGFFARELFLDTMTRLVVYPVAADLEEAEVLGEGVLSHVGLEAKPRAGVSEEFLGIREYRHGDPPRLIDWKSTARHGRMMVKEFEEEITTLVTFFVDLGRLGLVGVGDQTSVEYGIRCCASLAKRAQELGHDMQYFGVGQTVDHVPPGSGVGHLLAILDRLAFAKAQGDSAFPFVVKDFARHLPRGSTAILLLGATTIDFETMQPTVATLLDRRILPIMVLIDDRAFIKIYREQEDRHHASLPLEEIARRLQLMGARIHIIKRAKTIEQALVQGLEQEGLGS